MAREVTAECPALSLCWYAFRAPGRSGSWAKTKGEAPVWQQCAEINNKITCLNERVRAGEVRIKYFYGQGICRFGKVTIFSELVMYSLGIIANTKLQSLIPAFIIYCLYFSNSS